MSFVLLPVLDQMLELYQQPRGFQRFRDYLQLALNEKRDDLELPIAVFNPMAKEHVLAKLRELKELDAEALIEQAIHELPFECTAELPGTFQVALNLADDAMGGWTNRYTTDYQSKFQQQALTKRRFCLPLFWVSESYTPQNIHTRVQEYTRRLIYQLQNPKCATLQDHIRQEAFAQQVSSQTERTIAPQMKVLYQQYKETSNYPEIFCFLYGDKAGTELGYEPVGVLEPFWGLRYAGQLT